MAVFRGPLTLGDLADAEGVRSATMTGIVHGLVADGLVPGARATELVEERFGVRPWRPVDR